MSKKLERVAEQWGVLGYGGDAVLRECVDCRTPYPEFSASSHMRCWDCRRKRAVTEERKACERIVEEEAEAMSVATTLYGTQKETCERILRRLRAAAREHISVTGDTPRPAGLG